MPAVSAPIKAAAAGGIATKSTSSSRSVFAMAPIKAAAAAIEQGLLNIMEKPNTPPKLVISRSSKCVPLIDVMEENPSASNGREAP